MRGRVINQSLWFGIGLCVDFQYVIIICGMDDGYSTLFGCMKMFFRKLFFINLTKITCKRSVGKRKRNCLTNFGRRKERFGDVCLYGTGMFAAHRRSKLFLGQEAIRHCRGKVD